MAQSVLAFDEFEDVKLFVLVHFGEVGVVEIGELLGLELLHQLFQFLELLGFLFQGLLVVLGELEFVF